MQILAQNGTIIHTADKGSIIEVDLSQNQVVITTERYTHSDLLMQGSNYYAFRTLKALFELKELSDMYATAISIYFKQLIEDKYPTYKQMNIIRQGDGYNATDLQTMTSFIDDNRRNCKTKIAALYALTNIDDVVKYSLYT